MALRKCFLQLSRELPGDFVPMLSERVTHWYAQAKAITSYENHLYTQTKAHSNSENSIYSQTKSHNSSENNLSISIIHIPQQTKRSMSIYGIHQSTAMPRLDVIA